MDKMNITIFQVLTIGGKELWSEDDSLDVCDILSSNDIFLTESPIKKGDIYFCRVDTTKTNINDFYKWNEISLNDTETFCWRKFYTFGENEKTINWLPIPDKEYIGKYSYKTLLHMIHQLS